ncbi:MAG: GNAT family N-acetyltransferase [Flavobacteriales bacterium]|nr:GNAT family N-acetyltransferase [Flavobacteriales bacterium]
MSINSIICSLDQIQSEDWHQIMALRSDVFVVEQQCVYLDPDTKDPEATHLLRKEGDALIAYLRIIQSTAWHIGRVVVKGSQRGAGIGKQIIEEAIAHCVHADAGRSIEMSAQIYLCDFYRSLGFEAQGSMYLEDGIPHLRMVYQEPLK